MSAQPVSHRWRPLTNLSDDDIAAASNELKALADLWTEQRARLADPQVEKFNERLNREWAIETGIIEHVYTLDRGTTHVLIEHGIDEALISHDDTDQPPEFVAGIISDQKSAVDWLFMVVKQDRPLSASLIKELHALMTRRQSHAEGRDQFGNPKKVQLIHGDYKKWPNSPTRPDGSVHEYCPPDQVASEMDRLLDLHQGHSDVAPEVEAAWMHHRFTQIHPFQDGNGRVACAVASLVLIQAGLFPLAITRDDSVSYIRALEEADRGDLRPLVDLFVAVEKRWLVKALSIADQVREDAERVDQVIDAIADMFHQRDQQIRQDYDQAKATSDKLWRFTRSRLEEVRDELEHRIGNGTAARRVSTDSAEDLDVDRRFWHRYQVVQTASTLGYFANMAEFHQWTRLKLATENGRAEILVSFHGIGRDYRGLIGVSACFYRREEADDIEHQVIELQPVADELLQINYKEDPESVESRFRPWLEAALLFGLDQWRRGE